MPFVTAQPPTSVDQSWKYIHGMVCDHSIFMLMVVVCGIIDLIEIVNAGIWWLLLLHIIKLH